MCYGGENHESDIGLFQVLEFELDSFMAICLDSLLAIYDFELDISIFWLSLISKSHVYEKLLGPLGGLLTWSSLTSQLIQYCYLYKCDIIW